MKRAISSEGVLLLVVSLMFLGFIFIVAFLFRYRKRKEEAAHMKLFLEQEIVRSQLEIQEQTFKKISQEIHDHIGQMLSLAKLFLSTVPVVNKSPETERITEAHQLVSRSLTALRDLSHTLNSDYVSELGFLRAVEFELELMQKTGKLKGVLNVSGKVRKLDPQRELVLFRIIQETFNNTLKHGEAKTVELDIGYTEEGLSIKIADDGKGFDISAVSSASTPGIGMKNIQTRAKLIGAKVAVHSEPGKGTQTVIDWADAGQKFSL